MLIHRLNPLLWSSRRVSTASTRMAQSQIGNATLEKLKFDNQALRTLPVDASRIPGSRQVPGACFSLVTPSPVDSPEVVAVSPSALALLGLNKEAIDNADFAEYFSGNKILPGSEPASHCYCGHQFGYFSGQLGDGAAMYLGELINDQNERWEVQLKGSGLTPYSRTADGRKVLRSSIREFLCSEALHNLGIPTTRAGSCITSKSRVIRDMFYNGNAKNEQCTVISRIAKTFFRFGSFEIFKPTDEETGRAGPSVGQHEILHKMLNYVIDGFYPHLGEKFTDKEQMYTEFFKEVCIKTAILVAKWQCVGFCHGVLNTDNMSILGLTIDYGPFGFMEPFDPNFVCNSSDDGGRYAYKNQPDICKWNLEKFAEAIKEAVPLSKTLPIIKEYQKEFDNQYMQIMRKKLGLIHEELEEDEELVENLLHIMATTNADFTNSFRFMSKLSLPGMENFEISKKTAIDKVLSTCLQIQELQVLCKPRMDPRQLQAILDMARGNPALLHLMTGGRMGMIKAELDKLEKMEEFKDMTEEQLKTKNREKWMEWFVKYASRLKKEVKDGLNLQQLNKERVDVMNSTNPCFILRNYVAQNVIDEAENGNYVEINKVLKLLEHPYDEEVDLSEFANEDKFFDARSSLESQSDERSFVDKYVRDKTPLWALDLKVS